MEFKVRNRPNIPRNKYGYVTSISPNTAAGNTTSSDGNTIVSSNSCVTAERLAETHTIWGNEFNGTQNVEGDLTLSDGKNLTVGGTSTFNGNTSFVGGTNTMAADLHVYGETTLNDASLIGNLTVNGTSTIKGNTTFNGTQNTVNNNLTVNGLTRLNETEIAEDLIVSGTTDLNYTVNINATTNAENILPKSDKTYNLGNDNLQWLNVFANNAYLKNLTVTGSAHFFELIIDRVKSVGGAVLLTPADGFEIDLIEHTGNSYTLYWQCQDAEGNQRDNMWQVGDQAICKSFNQAKNGTTHEVTNKSWWVLVTATNTASRPIMLNGIGYNYITVTTNDYDGVLNPEVGDYVAMLGNRTDTARQSAIYISAATSIDTGIQAPLIACYQGINDYDLASHRKSYFDRTGAKFVGDVEIGGQSAEDYINAKVNETKAQAPYIGDDGYWYVYDSAQQKYIKSVKAQGDNGAPADFYTITPIAEIVNVNTSENLNVTAQYKIQHIVGNTITDITPSYDGYYMKMKANGVSTWTNMGISGNTCKYQNTYKTNYYKTFGGMFQTMYFALFYGNSTDYITQRAVPITASGAAFFSVKQSTDNSIASITSRVTAAETDISDNYTELTNRCSQIEQTAEGITSTVTQMKSNEIRTNLLPQSDLKGKFKKISIVGDVDTYNTVIRNAYKGMNSWRTYIPANDSVIRYYGLRWGGDGQTEAIILDPNKTYTLSVWIKTHENNNKCFMECHTLDGLYGNRISGKSQSKYIVPTAEWKQYIWNFTPKGEYNEIFILTNNSNDNGTASATPCDVEFCMPLLVENIGTEYSLSTYEQDIIHKNMCDNTDTFTIGGNLIVVNGNVWNDEDNNRANQIIYAYSQESDIEMAQWLFQYYTIQKNTDYVFSFDAKTNNNNSNIAVIIYHNNDPEGHSQVRYSENNDGVSSYYNVISLTNEWKRYFVHFHTKMNIYEYVYVLVRAHQNNPVYFRKPKLEIGANETEWTISKTDYIKPTFTSSLIEQKADEITLAVQNTGINIQDGVITLNANNTVVSNTLTVGSVKTVGEDATIEIAEGAMKIYGTNKTTPNIIFGIDNDGYAVLSYYDNNGNLLYNLGPEGIMSQVTETYNKFSNAIRFIRIDNGTILNNEYNTINVNEGTAYYKFIEGYKVVGSMKKYKISGTSTPSNYDGQYYKSKLTDAVTDGKPIGTLMANGWYFNGIQNPTTNDIYLIMQAVEIYNGKSVDKMDIYLTYSGDKWKLADQKFNVVTYQTPSNYRTLTGQ